jgi:hypothetical protein
MDDNSYILVWSEGSGSNDYVFWACLAVIVLSLIAIITLFYFRKGLARYISEKTRPVSRVASPFTRFPPSPQTAEILLLTGVGGFLLFLCMVAITVIVFMNATQSLASTEYNKDVFGMVEGPVSNLYVADQSFYRKRDAEKFDVGDVRFSLSTNTTESIGDELSRLRLELKNGMQVRIRYSKAEHNIVLFEIKSKQ